jgi:hypothetical protein
MSSPNVEFSTPISLLGCSLLVRAEEAGHYVRLDLLGIIALD